jgi:hypothetical protein
VNTWLEKSKGYEISRAGNALKKAPIQEWIERILKKPPKKFNQMVNYKFRTGSFLSSVIT